MVYQCMIVAKLFCFWHFFISHLSSFFSRRGKLMGLSLRVFNQCLKCSKVCPSFEYICIQARGFLIPVTGHYIYLQYLPIQKSSKRSYVEEPEDWPDYIDFSHAKIICQFCSQYQRKASSVVLLFQSQQNNLLVLYYFSRTKILGQIICCLYSSYLSLPIGTIIFDFFLLYIWEEYIIIYCFSSYEIV